MWQRHYFLLVAVIVIFVFKPDIIVIYVQYPVGGDGYLMGIAAQVFYDLRRAAKRSIGMYIPFLLALPWKVYFLLLLRSKYFKVPLAIYFLIWSK